MRFERDTNWNPLPDHKDVTAIAVDAHDRFYALHNGVQPFICFDDKYNIISKSLGGIFTNPHGLKVSAEGTVYITDNMDHTLRIFNKAGALLRQIGEPNVPSDTGFKPWYGDVIKSAGPFNMPTNSFVTKEGDFFVSDGYANARVHHFSKEGDLIKSWGTPGNGKGELNLPHGIAIDHQGRVLIADRENSRIQIFSKGGDYISQWTNIHRPCSLTVDHNGLIYVTEFGYATGRAPGTKILIDAPKPCVSIFEPNGQLVTRLGGDGSDDPDLFFAPHDICVNSKGIIYVCEIAHGVNVDWGPKAPVTANALHKFYPIS